MALFGSDKDWLKKDTLVDDDQAFACVSLVGPELPQKHSKMQIMLRGNMATNDEAVSHSEMLNSKHKSKFAVYVLEIGNWLRLPPTKDCMDSPEKHDIELNRIITEYLEFVEEGSKNFEKRKVELKKLSGKDNYDEASKILYADNFTPSGDSTNEEGVEETKSGGPLESPWNNMESYKVGEQTFGVVSIIPDQSSKVGGNFTVCALKIHGAFPTETDASSFAKRIQSSCSEFNIHVVDMYKWLTIPPDMMMMDKSVYPEINGKLNELIEGHRDNMDKAIEFQSSGAFQEDPTKGLPAIEDALETNPHPSISEEVLETNPPPSISEDEN